MTQIYDIKAERQALAFLMDDPDPETVSQSLSRLKGDEFYDPRHRVIFEMVGSLFNREQPIRPSATNVCRMLEDSGTIEKAGGFDYVAGIPTEINGLGPSAVIDLPVINDRIANLAKRRVMESLGLEIAEMARRTGIQIKEIQGRVTEILAEGEKEDRFQTYTDVEKEIDSHIDAWFYGQSVGFLRTGWPSFDRSAGGIPKGELTEFGARPGVGKSRTISELANQFRSSGHVVIINTLEMTTTQLFDRELCKRAGVSYTDLNIGKYASNMEVRERLMRVKREISGEEGIYVNDNSSQTAAQMNVRAAMLQIEKGRVDVVFVDYLELLQDVQNAGSEQRLGVVSACRRLKIAAKSLNCAVVAASQLNRQAPVTDLPSKDDLMLGGEAEAGMIVTLWSPIVAWNERGPFTLPDMVDKRPDGSPNPDEFFLRIAKNRHGGLGIVKMHMNPVTGRITDPSIRMGAPTDAF